MHRIASSSGPSAELMLVSVPIADGRPSSYTAATNVGSSICPRTVKPFRCASWLAVSATPNPAVGVAFSQSGPAMRSPADQLGGHRGLN